MTTPSSSRRSKMRRVILATAIAPAALTFSASGAAVTWNSTPSAEENLAINPVYGEGLREGFVGRNIDGERANDDETTPNPNFLGGPEAFNETLGLRMGQINAGDPPDPDGFPEANGLQPGWANSRTFIYTGQIKVSSSFLAFVANNDDTDWLKINGVIVLDDNGWDTAVQADSNGNGNNLNTPGPGGDPNLVAGLGLTLGQWYDFEYRVSDTGGGGAGPSAQGPGWNANYGVGMNTTGFQSDGVTPLGTSVNGIDYFQPEEVADGTPDLFRYLITPAAGNDDVTVAESAVVTISGTGDTATENSITFAQINNAPLTLTVNNGTGPLQKILVSNSTILASNDNENVSITGSAHVRLLNLDDNGRTGVILTKAGGTGDLILGGTAVGDGLNGVTIRVPSGRLVLEGGATNPIAGLTAPIQLGAVGAPAAILQVGARTNAGVTINESATIEHVIASGSSLGSATTGITLAAGKTLTAAINAGSLAVNGGLAGAGGFLSKTGGGTLTIAGTSALQGVTINGGRTEFSGPTTFATNPTLTAGTLALTSSGNSIPGTYTVASGATLEAVSGGLGTGNAITLAGGTVRLLGAGQGLIGRFYNVDPGAGATNAIGNFGDFGTYTNYFAGLTPNTTAVTTQGGVTELSYDPAGGDTAMFSRYGFNANNNIVSRMLGKISIPEQGEYIFSTRSDDGSVVYIDGQLVVNNNFFQGMTTRTGTVTLSPGLHDIDIGYYEGGGGNGLVVQWDGPSFDLMNLSNAPLLTRSSGPFDHSITVTQNSTIEAEGNLGVNLTAITLSPGLTLTTNGDTLSAATVNLTGANGPQTFAGTGTLVIGRLNDGGGDRDILKIGSGALVLDNTTSAQLQNAGSSIEIREGALGLVFGPGGFQPQGNASLSFTGGSLIISSKGGPQTFPIPPLVGNAAIIARQIGSGVAGPVTVTLGGNLNAAADQTLTLGTADNYTLAVGGTASGSGNIVVTGNGVQTTSNTALQGLKVSVGTATTAASLRFNSPAAIVNSITALNPGSSLVIGTGTGPSTLTVDTTDSTTLAGPIVDATGSSAQLIKAGTGTLSLTSGANTYSGGTRILGGTLSVIQPGSSGTGLVELAGGTLQVAKQKGLVGEFFNVGPANTNNHNPNWGPEDLALGGDFAMFTNHYESTLGPTQASRRVVNTAANGVAELNFPSVDTAPFAVYGVPFTDNIQTRFTGAFFAPVTGVYNFGTTSDDGSVLFINGQSVVYNNRYQGMTRREGTVTLTAGLHNIAIGFYEGGGGAGLQVDVTLPGATRQFLNNATLFADANPVPLNNAVNVTANSTIDVSSFAATGTSLTMQAGRTLTTTGGDLTFATLTLPAAGTYTFDASNILVAGAITDSGAAVNIVKNGTGVLVLDNTTTAQLQNASSRITVNAGALGLLLGGALQPQGNAQITFNGGGVVLSSKGGDQVFQIPQFNGNGILEARQLGSGVAGPVTITATGNLNVGPTQTLTLGAGEGYTLAIAGTGSGGGNVVVRGTGGVRTGSDAALSTLNITIGEGSAPGVLRLATSAPTIGSLAGNAGSTLVVGNGTAPATLNVNGSGSGTFNGTIAPAGTSVITLNKSGGGTLTLNGTNNIAATNITGGVVAIGSTASIGTGPINISAGGTLKLPEGGALGEYWDSSSGGDAGSEAGFGGDLALFNSFLATKGAPEVVAKTTTNGRTNLKFSTGGGLNGGGFNDPESPFADQAFTAFNNIIARLTGAFVAESAGTYTFTTRSDDGSVLFINGVKVVDNNRYQGMTNATGTIDLPAGTHSIAVGFYEGGGGAGLEVRVTPPGGSDMFIANSMLAGFTGATQPLNLTGNGTVDGNNSSHFFGPLNPTAGSTLTVNTGSVSFSETNLTTASGTYGFAGSGRIVTNKINDNGAAITIDKSGSGELILNNSLAQLANAGTVLNSRGGFITAVASATNNPLGSSTVNLDGGGLRLSTSGGDVSFSNSIRVLQSGTIAAGNFGGGGVNGGTVRLNSPLTIASGQTLSVQASNDTRLNLAGTITGAGNLTAAGGQVDAANAINVTNLNVTGGTLNTTGSVTSAQTTVTSGGSLAFNGNAYTGGLINVNGGAVETVTGVNNLSDRLRFGSGANALTGRLFAEVREGILTDGGIATLLSRPGAATSALTGPLDFGPVFAGDAKIADHFGVPLSATGAFTAAWTGFFRAPTTGDFTLNGSQNDDTMAFWIDLDRNGRFEAAGAAGSELVVQGGCCGLDVSGTFTLTEGQQYRVAFVIEDTGGGGSIVARASTPTIADLTLVNPSGLPGAFSSDRGGLDIGAGSTLRATTADGAGLVHVNGTLNLNSASAASSNVEALSTTAGGTLALEAGNTLVAQRLTVHTGNTLIKTGPGTLTANTQELLQGATLQIDGGVVNLNGPGRVDAFTGSISGSVVVNAGRLGGSGGIGQTTVNTGATLAPGNSPGIMTVGGDLTLNPGSRYEVEIGRSTASPQPLAGVDYDQTIVTGFGTGSDSTSKLTLTGSNLAVLLFNSAPLMNDIFFIIINDGSDAVEGTFAGLTEGSTFTANGTPFRITYMADSTTSAFTAPGGNDVALLALIPEPGTLVTLMSGFGMLVGLQRFRRRQAA